MAADLPQELVESVLQHAYYDERSQPDRGTLSACSMVCRDWCGPAQRILFYNVYLPALRAEELFTSPLEHTQSLVTSIRCLELDITSAGRSAEEDVILAITHCTGLYELTLRVGALHSFDDVTMQQLRRLANRPSTKPLRAIKLMTLGIQSPLLYQTLDIWPSIQFVRLGQELASPHPRTYPPAFKLYELTLHRVPNVRNIEWLLSASLGHLRILEFRDEPGRTYDNIFQQHGPYLESLRMFHHSKRTASILAMCPNLKEYVVIRLSSFLPLDGIPRSLEHLSFRNYEWATNETLNPVIKVIDNLPKLRVVTSDPNAASHSDWNALREKCLGRGIELRADAPPIFAFDDPVPVKRYPRRRSVSNFSFMNDTRLQ